MGRGTLNSEQVDEEKELDFRKLCQREGWLNEEGDESEQTGDAASTKSTFLEVGEASGGKSSQGISVSVDSLNLESNTRITNTAETGKGSVGKSCCQDETGIRRTLNVVNEKENHVNFFTSIRDDKKLGAPAGSECRERGDASTSGMFVDGRQSGSGEDLIGYIPMESKGEEQAIEIYLRMRKQGRHLEMILGDWRKVMKDEENRASLSIPKERENSGEQTHALDIKSNGLRKEDKEIRSTKSPDIEGIFRRENPRLGGTALNCAGGNNLVGAGIDDPVHRTTAREKEIRAGLSALPTLGSREGDQDTLQVEGAQTLARVVQSEKFKVPKKFTRRKDCEKEIRSAIATQEQGINNVEVPDRLPQTGIVVMPGQSGSLDVKGPEILEQGARPTLNHGTDPLSEAISSQRFQGLYSLGSNGEFGRLSEAAAGMTRESTTASTPDPKDAAAPDRNQGVNPFRSIGTENIRGHGEIHMEACARIAELKEKEEGAVRTTLAKIEAIMNSMQVDQQGPDRIKFKEISGTFDLNAVGVGDIEIERVGVSNEAAPNTCHLNENRGLANGAGKPTFGIGGFKKLARLGLHKVNDIGNSPEQSEGDARTTVTGVAYGEEDALESLREEELQTWRSNHINDDTLKTILDHQTKIRAGALEGGRQDANMRKDCTANRVVLKVGDSRGARLSDSLNGLSASRLGEENKQAQEKMERVAEGWTEEEDDDEEEEDDIDYTPSQEALEFQGTPSESEEEGMGMERGVEDFEGLKFKISDGFWELGSELDEEELINDDEEVDKDRNMSTEEGEDAIVMDTEDQAPDVNQGEGGSLSSRCFQGLSDIRHQRNESPAIKSSQPSSEGNALSKRTRSGCSLVDVSLDLLETRLPKSDEMDYFETVNDEEEYHNFLTAIREVVNKSKEQELEEDPESEDDDEDFDIELQEELESAYNTEIDSDGRKRKRMHRPETREKRRQRARLQLRLNQQYAFRLPSSLPYVILANPTIAEGTTKSDKLFNVLPLNAKRQPESQGFTAQQIGQLYCLIHEHVQLLVQIFAVCLFDPAHQHLSPKLHELLKELNEAREKSIAMKHVPFPDFCFRPPYNVPSVHEEEQDPVSRKTSSVCSDVPKLTDIGDSWPLLFNDAGFAQQSPEACLRLCPSDSVLCQLQWPRPSTFIQNSSVPFAPLSVGIDSSDCGDLLLGTSETEQSFKVGNISEASTTEVDPASAPSPLGKPSVCSPSASNPPTTMMEKGFTGPSLSGIDPPSLTLTTTHFDWAAYVHGQVQSLLDVAPLSLLKDFLSDIFTIADDYKKKYGERGANPDQCEWVPLFPVKMPSSQGPKRPNLQNPTLNLVLGTLTPVPDSKPFVKKTMAAALVESTKRQSLVLVPKAVAEAMLRFFPLFNKAMYPHKAPRASTANRLLFTDSEDELLAMGLMVYNNDWEAIQRRYLPSKSTHQIFVRQKNRSSARAPDNSIKAVRRMKASLLTLEEIDCIQEALKTYKYDWAKVWEFCVPYRDPTRLPRQWRNSINIHKPFEDNTELYHLIEGGEQPTPITPNSSILQIEDGPKSFFPANTMEVEEDFNVDDFKCFSESVHPYGTPNADRITHSTTSFRYSGKSWSPAPLTPKSSEGKSKQCKKGTPMQAIPPPLLSVQLTARLVQTAALGLQNPFVPPKYPAPKRRFKNRTVKLAPGLPSLKLPSSVRVLSQSDAEAFPGFFNSKSFGSQPLLPASPWSLQGPDCTGMSHVPYLQTGFSIQKILTTGFSPRTISGRVPVWAYEGDGLPVHGKRKSSNDFAVPNIMRKRPGLLHSRLGEDIAYPANVSGSQAEGLSPKNLVLFGKTLPNAQQSGQLHSARKNANTFSSGGLPPATQQSKSTSPSSFLPTSQHPFWLSKSEAAPSVGLDNVNEGRVLHKPLRGHSALDCTGTKSEVEIANPITQLLVQRKHGTQPSKRLQKQTSKAGASKHMLVHGNGLNEERREDRGTIGRKTSETLPMLGGKKPTGLTGELIRCIRKKVVATEWGVSKKELALKEVPINHNKERQQSREAAAFEDVSHPSGPSDQSHMMTFVEGSGRASRTRRLRGAGIRVVVPRATKRKETRREQEMHVDDGVEEPFFEPHQIVMEQEELGTSDYDNSEDVIESVKLVKPPSVKQIRRNGIPNRDKHSKLESFQSERKRAHEDAPSRTPTSLARVQSTQMSGSSDNQMPKSTQCAKEETPFHKGVPSPPEEGHPLSNVVPESDNVLCSADIPSSTSPEAKPLIESTRRRDVRIPSRFYIDEMLGFWPRPRHVKREVMKGREELPRSTVGRTSLKRKGVKALMDATESEAVGGKGRAESAGSLKKRSGSMQQMKEDDGSADGTPETGMEGDRMTDITSASGHSAVHEGHGENGPVTKCQHGQDSTALEAAEVLTVFSQKPSKQKNVASKQQG